MNKCVIREYLFIRIKCRSLCLGFDATTESKFCKCSPLDINVSNVSTDNRLRRAHPQDFLGGFPKVNINKTN